MSDRPASPLSLHDLDPTLSPRPDRVFRTAAEVERHLRARGLLAPVTVRRDRYLADRRDVPAAFGICPAMRGPWAFRRTPDPNADLAVELRTVFRPTDGFSLVAKATRDGWDFRSNDDGSAAELVRRRAQAIQETNTCLAC